MLGHHTPASSSNDSIYRHLYERAVQASAGAPRQDDQTDTQHRETHAAETLPPDTVTQRPSALCVGAIFRNSLSPNTLDDWRQRCGCTRGQQEKEEEAELVVYAPS